MFKKRYYKKKILHLSKRMHFLILKIMPHFNQKWWMEGRRGNLQYLTQTDSLPNFFVRFVFICVFVSCYILSSSGLFLASYIISCILNYLFFRVAMDINVLGVRKMIQLCLNFKMLEVEYYWFLLNTSCALTLISTF